MKILNFYFILFCGILESEILGGLFVFGQTCGKVQVGRPNIVGGNYAIHGAFPWVAVLIDNDGEPFCGGTLLSKNKVLTAAHCIHGKGDTHLFLPRDITVILGAHNLTKVHEQGKMTIGVERIDIHQDWNPKSASFDADISMLTLTDDVSFTRFIQPICLMSFDSEVATIKKGYSAGYGKSEKDGNTEQVLKSIETPIASSNEECFYSNEGLLQMSSLRTFCGGSRGGTGVCLGDSGNGLFIEHSQTQTYYLRGIVSASLWTNNNCDVNNYAIFADVLNFNSWIIERIDQIDRPFIYNSSNTQVTPTRPLVTTSTPSTTTYALRRSPSITPIKSPIEVTEGTNFELPCISYGSPSPIVRWTSASGNVQTNGNVLKITNVSFRNSGKYICAAINSEGRASIDVFLVVRAASSTGPVPWETHIGPIAPSIESPLPSKQVKADFGSRNKFTCRSNKNLRLDWRRADGQRLQSNAVSFNGVLVIDPVGYEDAGTYICVSTDGFGNTATVLSAKLEVVDNYGGGNSPAIAGDVGTVAPRITFQPNSFANPVTAGDPFWIRCVVSGSEPMEVKWGLIGRLSSTSSAQVEGNVLRFDRVLMSDKGKYGCVAENVYGRAEKSFTLSVTPGHGFF